MRYSKQREVILEVVNHSFNHPTAEMVYDKVKEKIPNISLGTIYRNLNALADASLIKRISIPKDFDHFDHRNCDHYHFCCMKCHQLYDLPASKIEMLIHNCEKEEQVQITDCEVLLYGICKKCLKGKDEENGIKRK